jgi:hypothetical protein
MRNLLALLAALAIGFSAACYFRGWCTVESVPSETGKNAFRVEIDRVKISRDVSDGAQAIQRALTPEPGDKTKNTAENEKP